MAVTIDGAGPIAGLTSIASPTTLNGLTIPTTGFGKVLQVVRTTDSTPRSTTSTSFVDAGISVTITPQKSTSTVLVIWNATGSRASANDSAQFRITDSSNNPLSGAEKLQVYEGSTAFLLVPFNAIGYATPATTSAVTYKGQFSSEVGSATTGLRNGYSTGQLYAIEVSA